MPKMWNHGRSPRGFSFEPRKRELAERDRIKTLQPRDVLPTRSRLQYCWIGSPRSKGRLIPRSVRMWILHVEYETSGPPAGRDFIFETKEAALLKALEFHRGAGINIFTKCRHIEGLSGERMEQTEIEEWCRKQPKALR